MISNFEFVRKCDSPFLEYRRAVTGRVEPALKMHSDVLDADVLADFDRTGVVQGGSLKEIRGFKDKTPWKPMRFYVCKEWQRMDLDPGNTLKMQDQAMLRLTCRMFGSFDVRKKLQFNFDTQWTRHPHYRYWSRIVNPSTPEMSSLETLLIAELEAQIKVFVDPMWWWDFKCAEPMNRIDKMEAEISKQKTLVDQFAEQLKKRQLAIPS